MKKLWRLLNSRKLAVYLLFALLLVLVVSTLLPSTITVSEEHWEELARERPVAFWVASHFATPYVVRSTVFIVPTVFLFFSTLACTVTRVRNWARTRKSEFEKEQAFSFSVERELTGTAGEAEEELLRVLRGKRWECAVSREGGGTEVVGQKGFGLGFWGSVVFHVGLIACFLGAPVSALTVFRGEFLVTEGITTPLKGGFVYSEGKDIAGLPDADVTVMDLEGRYAEGIYKVHFGGTVRIGGMTAPFSVNNPVEYEGYQLTLDSFGYSPQITMERDGSTFFDYFLNLRQQKTGDYFDLPSEELTLFVLLFPDFYQEGTILKTRSREPNNPICLVRFLRGEQEVAKGLVELGGETHIGGYRVGFPELRNWAGFVVVREWGVHVLAVGMVIGLAGLLVRFLSNERIIEMRLRESTSGSSVAVRGYSRYYPAFLEKEVREMAARVAGEEPAP
jgi:cytochrome c biogenesis protein